MDPASLAAALVGAQAGQTQVDFAAKMMKMNSDQKSAIADVVASAAANTGKLANLAAGIGQNLDIAA